MLGNSLALGDVNGDGKKDLVVAAPPCTGMTGKGSLAIYAGDGTSFSSPPVIAEVDWQSPCPSASGRNSVVSIGDVNGDGFADILVRSQTVGTLVYAGGADLAMVLQAPLFRVPFVGAHYFSFLGDLDGDGLDDLVVTQAATRKTTVYRATPGAETPFTEARIFPDRATRVLGAGDVNGDGAQDMLYETSAGSRLYLVARRRTGLCEGGLSVSPAWTTPEAVMGFFPDQNGDGFPRPCSAPRAAWRCICFSRRERLAHAHLERPRGCGVPGPLAHGVFRGHLDQGPSGEGVPAERGGPPLCVLPAGRHSPPSCIRAGPG